MVMIWLTPPAILNGLSGALLPVALSVRRVVVLFEVILNFGVGIQDFAFKGIIAEDAFEPVIGEGRFTHSKPLGKFGVREKAVAVKHRTRAFCQLFRTALDFRKYLEYLVLFILA